MFRFPRHRGFSLQGEKLEAPLASFRLSGIRSVLAAYFLTFGLYGYGSDLELQEPLTFLPLLSGLIVSIYFSVLPSNFFDRWTFRMTIRSKHVVALLGIFALLIFMSYSTLQNEQVGDELSYVQFAVVHSLELAERLPFLDQTSPIGIVLQLLSLALILGFILPMLLFIALAPLKTTIGVVAITVTVLQFAYSNLGGWGWGYTKLAWFPYLLPVTIFGPESTVFGITSLAIVALGFTALFFTLKKLNIGFGLRGVIVLTLIALPVQALYYSSLDHIVYFVAIAMPILVFLLARPSNHNLEGMFLVLAIGSLFRITIVFLLIALIFWILTDKPYRNGIPQVWRMTQPALLILVPYGGGILVSTPLFSAGDSAGELEFGFAQIAHIFTEQLGFAETLILVSVVLATMILLRNRLPLFVFFGIVFSFYFVLLGLTGLVGEARYSVEWGISLFLIALASLGRESSRAKKSSSFLRILPMLALTTVATMVLFGNQSLFWKALEGQPQARSQNLNSYTPVGYSKIQKFLVESQVGECVPVGVVYGAGNEILANRPLGVVRFARKSHLELQQAQKAISGDWSPLTGEVASSSEYECLYGSRAAFLDINDSPWEGWDLAFTNRDTRTGIEAVVLRRPGEQ